MQDSDEIFQLIEHLETQSVEKIDFKELFAKKERIKELAQQMDLSSLKGKPKQPQKRKSKSINQNLEAHSFTYIGLSFQNRKNTKLLTSF